MDRDGQAGQASHGGCRLVTDVAGPRDEHLAIRVVGDDLAELDPPDAEMLEGPRRVEASLLEAGERSPPAEGNV